MNPREQLAAPRVDRHALPRASHRLSNVSQALFLLASLAYGVALALPCLHVLDRRPLGDAEIETRIGIDLLFEFRNPIEPSTLEVILWSLNLILFATPLLLRIRPKRPWALVPMVFACAAAWWWASCPGSPDQAPRRAVYWEVDVGLFVWLGALAGFATATMVRWWASISAALEWRRRKSAPTARLEIDDTTIAHFSPAVRALVHGASRLRQRLDVAPRDAQVIESLYDWVIDLRQLSEVDDAELERLGVPTSEVVVAAEALWNDVANDSAEPLERLDAALEAFIASSTTGGRPATFR